MQQIVTCLCIFHAAATARKAYGTAGWNQPYPFSLDDLLCSAQTAMRSLNEVSQSAEPPWAAIRQMAGEVLYGGHITDRHDRYAKCTHVAGTCSGGQYYLHL